MALTDPRTVGGVLCILGEVTPLNDFVDDLAWWRANLRDGDSLDDVVRRMPLDDSMKAGLQRDLSRLDPLSGAMLLAALRVATNHAESLDIDWRPEGPPSVTVEARQLAHMEVRIYLDCQHTDGDG